jgi:ADP-ribose pyrophosphatase
VTDYTDWDVIAQGLREGWADPEENPADIDWPPRQAAAAIPFKVVNGRPVCPFPVTTGIDRGRNQLGRWAESRTADALGTATWEDLRWLVMVDRGDGGGWATPGGFMDPGETPVQAVVRELAEETGLVVPSGAACPLDPRYIPDRRASGEAWIVTTPVYFHLGTLAELPALTAGDDARGAVWVAAPTYDALTLHLRAWSHGEVYPAHVGMLRDFLG